MMKKKLPLFVTILFLLAGCGFPNAVTPTPTLDVNAIRTMAASTALYELTRVAALSTPTLAVTDIPAPSPTTAATPTIAVTPEKIDATAVNNLTVRSWPGRGGDNLGGIFYNHGLTVLARNIGASWYLIVWPDSPAGYAWVNANGVELKSADLTQLPIALENGDGTVRYVAPVTWQVEGTPLPLPPVDTGQNARPATVVSTANVRVCPTKGCMVIGTLEAGQQINMTGRLDDKSWAQFEYPSGPGGRAWVSRDAIQPGSEAFGGLPYFDLLGQEVTPEPPTPTLDPNITPTVTNTPLPTPAGALANVSAQTTIYAEPSSLSQEVGVLNPNDKLQVTGISINGLWYQIQYPPLTEGRAYISQKYVRVLGDMRSLPYFDDKGNLLPTP